MLLRSIPSPIYQGSRSSRIVSSVLFASQEGSQRSIKPRTCGYIFFMDEKRDLLRHTLATLAYRTSRALENAPESFAEFDGAGRRPVQILAHMGDLLDWALSMAQGSQRWQNSPATRLACRSRNAFSPLSPRSMHILASMAPMHAPVERLFQGPDR